MEAKPPVYKATAMEVRADLDHEVVSLRFWENQGAGPGIDIWLASGSILALKAQIDQMLQANPEMLRWGMDKRPN